MTDSWTAHFNTFHYDGSWTVLPLRSPNGEDNIFPELQNADRFEDHANMELFPAIKAFISQLECEIMSIRLLKLAAGSSIKEHRDAELAFEHGEARLHFPIQTNPNVDFFINDEKIVMQAGEAWYINANLPHRVSNNGCTDRVHLVIDCKVNAWLKKMILHANILAHGPEENRDPETLKQMILLLKEQGTPGALQVAATLQAEYDHLLTDRP